MKTFIINGEEFKTKKSVEDKVKGIFKNNKDGYLFKEDFDFVRDLLNNHPEAESKIGCGVSGIMIGKSTKFGTRCFFIHRTDGTMTDLSYHECLAQTPNERKFANACRNSVSEYIQDYKYECFAEDNSPVCPCTGESLSLNNSHVDHKSPNTFKKIVDDFISEYKIDINKVSYLDGDEDNCFGEYFADPNLAFAFNQYHWMKAELQLVSVRANLSILKKLH